MKTAGGLPGTETPWGKRGTILVVFKPAQNASRCTICCKLASCQQTSVGAKS